MDFHDYNGIDYENSRTASSSVPVRVSWDDHYVYDHIFGGAVVVTWKMTYRSPVERILEIERIRVLDLIDVPSIPGYDDFFRVGTSEIQTLVSTQGSDILRVLGNLGGNSNLYTYSKYQNTDVVPNNWPAWLVVHGHELFNAYQGERRVGE
jgi:hypothetical protein